VFSELKNVCVWNKTNGGMGSFIGASTSWCSSSRLGPLPIPIRSDWAIPGVTARMCGTTPASIRYGRVESRMHPTVKPVALIADAVMDCTRRDELVLDPFAGSGSTLIAAHQTGRRARLIEYDPAYCDQILARFQKVTGKEPRLAATGQTFETVAEGRARDLAVDSVEREVT
jgi:DNA methylase